MDQPQPQPEPHQPSHQESDEEKPLNSPLRLHELQGRINGSELWGRLWDQYRAGRTAGPLLTAELDYRFGEGHNNCFCEIIGPQGSGKSMVELMLDHEATVRLEKRGIKVIHAITTNYAQSTDKIFELDDESGARVLIHQDEGDLITGPESMNAIIAFLNMYRSIRKRGHSVFRCCSDHDDKIKWAFSLEVWIQLPGYLFCMLYNRNFYPQGFLDVAYPPKEVRDEYDKEKDTILHAIVAHKGHAGVVTDEDMEAEAVYAETAKRYIGRLKRALFYNIAKKLYPGRTKDHYATVIGICVSKYELEHPRSAERTYKIEYHGIKKEPKKEPQSLPKTVEQAMRNAVNRYATKESIKKEIEFETIIVPRLSCYANYRGIQEGYGGRNSEGRPDAVADFDGKPVVIGIEYNLGTTWNSNTIFKGRLEAERKAAREMGALCHFFVWNEDKNSWYGPFTIDPNSGEDFTHSWDDSFKTEKHGSYVPPQETEIETETEPKQPEAARRKHGHRR